MPERQVMELKYDKLSGGCDLDTRHTRAEPESMSSLFGYFRVSGSFLITGFTPRFLRSFPLLPYLHSHYLSFTM